MGVIYDVFACWLKCVECVWRLRLRTKIFLFGVSCIVLFTAGCFFGLGFCSANVDRMRFSIKSQWDGHPINHDEIHLDFSATDKGLRLTINAPFFNDPANPGSDRGQPKQGLWNFEVVEAFFMNEKKQYLEVELCPHGQHLVILLNGYRSPFKDLLPLEYHAVIEGKKWKGEAVIPWGYFPPAINRFNAYAIHGSESKRTYEALFPVPTGLFSEPDFHRLDYFGQVNFDNLWPSPTVINNSRLWPTS